MRGPWDWYRWGVEALVTNQAKDGAWVESASTHTWNSNRPVNYKAALNTAFALLFLKRSHPMKELTPKLPFTAKELNEGIAQLRPKDKFPLHPVTAPPESRERDRPATAPSRSEKSER